MDLQINLGRHWGTQKNAGSEVKKAGKLDLDKCFVCSGIWFDEGEMKKIAYHNPKKKTVGSYINESKLYKKLNEKGGLCPRCKIPMRKMRGKNSLRKIAIDVCKKCEGVWLDGGEVNYLLKDGAAKRVHNVWRYFWSNRFIPE